MYIIALLFTGTLRLSLNPGIFYLNLRMGEKIKKKKMWILLLVHITLHGMIGGLLKHSPTPPKGCLQNNLLHLYKHF